MGEPRLEGLARPAIGDPGIAARRGQGKRARPIGGDPQGDTVSGGAGQGAGVAHRIEVAVVVDVVLAEQPVEEVDVLVEAIDPLAQGEVLTEALGVPVAAGAQAEEEAVVADVGQTDRVAEQDVGVPVVG